MSQKCLWLIDRFLFLFFFLIPMINFFLKGEESWYFVCKWGSLSRNYQGILSLFNYMKLIFHAKHFCTGKLVLYYFLWLWCLELNFRFWDNTKLFIHLVSSYLWAIPLSSTSDLLFLIFPLSSVSIIYWYLQICLSVRLMSWIFFTSFC